MSYGELAARSKQMAGYLVSLGVGPDVPVAVCFERSFDLIASALAVLIAGGAYLPVDPAWPAARVQQVLEDAGTPIVLTRGRLGRVTSGNGRRVVDIDAERDEILRMEAVSGAVDVVRENLAYIIYTSGSTGQPKGVEVTHGNLLNLIFWHRRFFDIQPTDRASHLAGVAFDASVWEIWPYLTAGVAIVLAGEEVRKSAPLLRDWLVQERITVAFVPTVMAEAMLAESWPEGSSLRYLLTGGGALHRVPSPSFPAKLVNNYGPTECTVVATAAIVEPSTGSDSAPPIGNPIAHTKIYILNDEGNPVRDGEIGEIYIGGTNVARGYRNRPAATESRFLPDRFSGVPGARLYRTGDLGCFLPDGQIAFCGRNDEQIEIRGYRVEPDEIVTVLDTHPLVSASAVIAYSDCSGKRLVAYIVPPQHGAASVAELLDFVSARLPEYMVPASFVQMKALPIDFNGKLDRNALPAPGRENLMRDEDYQAPGTPTEVRLSSILATLLSVERIGVDDNFFLLGLHSLLATQVAARVYENFGVQLLPRHLFEAMTVARLAAEVDRQLMQRLDSLSDEEVARLLEVQ